MDISAAIRLIGETSVAAAMPRTIKTDAEPSHVYWLADGKGGIERKIAEETPPALAAHDLTTVVAFAREAGNGCEVWYSDKGVVAFPFGDRRGYVIFKLTASSQFLTFDKQLSLKQAELIRLLRTTLSGCADVPSDLLSRVRKVSFEHLQKSDEERRQARTSLGREITDKLAGVAELPEQVVFRVPVFVEQHIVPTRATIECDFDADAPTERFIITPLPGQHFFATMQGVDTLRLLLAKEMADVEKAQLLHGWPWK